MEVVFIKIEYIAANVVLQLNASDIERYRPGVALPCRGMRGECSAGYASHHPADTKFP
jgi:hypothetical protein